MTRGFEDPPALVAARPDEDPAGAALLCATFAIWNPVCAGAVIVQCSIPRAAPMCAIFAAYCCGFDLCHKYILYCIVLYCIIRFFHFAVHAIDGLRRHRASQ